MLERIPRLLLAAGALLGLFVSLSLIGSLSTITAWTGVEDEPALFMFFHAGTMNKRSFLSGFISFGLLGAVAASIICRKAHLGLKAMLPAMVIMFAVSGTVLGQIQNSIVSDIGQRLVAHYPDKARLALDTYYVQRLTSIDNNYKNTLIPGYSGKDIHSLEATLFRVNLFYLLADPRLIIGTSALPRNWLRAYFDEFVDYEKKRNEHRYIKASFSPDVFTKLYATPSHDLQRIHYAAVVPVVLATSIFSLMVSVIILVGELAGLASKGWIRLRAGALAVVILAFLVVPLFIDTHYDAIAAQQASVCADRVCSITVHLVDWLFRFEVGVLSFREWVTG